METRMSLLDANNTPSTAYNPDPDWSQVSETVLMLNLAVAQIVHTLQDGEESIATLGDSFTAMVNNIDMARSAATELTDSTQKETILENCQTASSQIQHAIVAFQFYDRLSQRLSHVANSLASLGTLVSDQTRLSDPAQWRNLQDNIKSRYTLEIERQMFEAILDGASVEDAMQLIQQAEANKPDDDIEFF